MTARARGRLAGSIVVAVAGVLAVGAASRAARGNSAAPVEAAPGELGAAATFRATGQPGGLAVDEETLTLDCGDDAVRRVLECAFSARYAVTNPTAAPAQGVGAFYARDAASVRVTVDGRAADRALSDAERAALERSVARHAPPPGRGDDAVRSQRPDAASETAPTAYGFALAVPPGGRVTLAVEGRLAANPSHPRGYDFMIPVIWRHPWMMSWSSATPYSMTYRLEYLVYPLATWAGKKRVLGEIRWPARMALESEGLASLEARDGGAGGDAGAVEAPWGQRARRFRATPRSLPVLDLRLRRPEDVFYPGGPVVAVGTRFGAGAADRAPVGRVGWEWAWFGGLLQSLSLEADGRGYRAVVPMVAESTVLIVGAGLAVPVALAPERRAGVRAQLTLSLPTTALVWYRDFWRPAGGRPAESGTGLAVQLTL